MSSPAIGDIVHYVSYGTPGGEYESVCRAAVVTEVVACTENRCSVGLAVLNPTGMFFNTSVPQSEEVKGGGSWHYRCPKGA